MAEGNGWNPWHALCERKHLTLEWAEIEGAHGLLVDRPDGRKVILDFRLSRRARRAVLAHKLVHDERDLLYSPATPGPVVDKEEALVRAETLRRLVPPAGIGALVAAGEDARGVGGRRVLRRPR